MTDDTIFALASAPGRAGIAVVRISGANARDALKHLGCVVPLPRKATRVRLIDPHTQDLLDDGLVLWFPSPHSFTGEDVAELHLHGGRAIITSVLDVLARVAGLRPAEPGEFTRRAFAHDKLDLTQAEALADVIDAETRAQAKQALRQMGGALKELYDSWRLRLVHALAHLEAVIDFPDEDLPPDVANKVWPDVRDLAVAIRAHLNDDHRGERVRAGVRVVIVGAPNAGKSSLLNWLARRDAAIVSNIPGTTRDAIEVHLDVSGYAATVVDTAGLRTTTDEIETEGVRRTRRHAADADIKIALFDATAANPDSETLDLVDDNTLVLCSKTDLLRSMDGKGPQHKIRDALAISVTTGAGLDVFLSKLEAMIRARVESGAAVPLTRARHRRGLEECVASLDRALTATLPELASEDLRVAARALGRLTGRVEVDEILDVVFRDFCIGK